MVVDWWEGVGGEGGLVLSIGEVEAHYESRTSDGWVERVCGGGWELVFSKIAG